MSSIVVMGGEYQPSTLKQIRSQNRSQEFCIPLPLTCRLRFVSQEPVIIYLYRYRSSKWSIDRRRRKSRDKQQSKLASLDVNKHCENEVSMLLDLPRKQTVLEPCRSTVYLENGVFRLLP